MTDETGLYPKLFRFCIYLCVTLNTDAKSVFFIFLRSLQIVDDRLVYSPFDNQFSLSEDKMSIAIPVVSLPKFFEAEDFQQR
ncbi:hypothetical protein TNCV_132871 [Trichonephila clavipes]|nr:hypothetical protein TNCV_132871 [Trichonephila clavipes]